MDTNEIVIKIDKKYFRPCEVNSLIGDASKANKKLGWVPDFLGRISCRYDKT